MLPIEDLIALLAHMLAHLFLLARVAWNICILMSGGWEARAGFCDWELREVLGRSAEHLVAFNGSGRGSRLNNISPFVAMASHGGNIPTGLHCRRRAQARRVGARKEHTQDSRIGRRSSVPESLRVARCTYELPRKTSTRRRSMGSPLPS